MNVRRAAAAVATGVLLTVGLTATPAYAEDVDLKAFPAEASGAAGQTVAVTIAFEVPTAIPGPPAIRLDIKFPSTVTIKMVPSPACHYWGPFQAYCSWDSIEAGRHEVKLQVTMPDTPSTKGTAHLLLIAQGYTDPNTANNTGSLTLKRTAATSASPTASKKPSATPTPKASKRSATASPTTEETDAGAPTEGTPTDSGSATEISAVSTAGNDDSSALPVVIFGGAGALVVVGGFLLWLVLRRRSDEDDDDDEYADERFDRYR
ncbi:MAG: hypothetical protein HOU81_23370 [Hamadaea sp.]|uniref:hypothetical protein n=1 Tax=Hamadaea sp. TaxID=2024425 RepID=UPI001843808C|nr:hypothetical protein [Hamadaea sp.]NUR73764.1 hypothetical protein [Hamadaea sp.]NUT17838.1 hypothetical protein [Hamadaea sp.]